MSDPFAPSAALTLSLATAAGVISQSVARRLNIPGIVLLLAVGVLLGPDFANAIQPASLGAALPSVVGFAVAVILFEGGMNLELRRFGQRHVTIRRLVTIGAAITAFGGTLAAKYIMGWQWREAALFGCLVIVTGPTVVTPLVRRFKLVDDVSTVLEAEGILIDAVGAVAAVVALEIALETTGNSVAVGVLGVSVRLGFGALAGLIGGFFLWGVLRYRNIIPEGLGNVFTLAIVWALFESAEAVVHESGIAAVTVAGLVVGNLKTHIHHDLLEFKDQLTVLLIGMLFVVLAADVRIADVRALGMPGILTVAALVLLVRPATVFISTAGCSLGWRKRLFVSWIGPRGIIAAAVASLFAAKLAAAGVDGGQQLKALVFLVIAVTVVLAGLTGGWVARLLKVSQTPRGWLILGANSLSCALAQSLRATGEEVACIDSSVDHCILARQKGLEVILGNALEEDVMHEAKITLRAGVAAVTPNDEINLLFLQKVRMAGGVKKRLAALSSADLGATPKMVRDEGGHVLFGDEYDVELWAAKLRSGQAVVEMISAGPGADLKLDQHRGQFFVPLVHQRGDSARPMADDVEIREGDVITFAIASAERVEARQWLQRHGWEGLAS